MGRNQGNSPSCADLMPDSVVLHTDVYRLCGVYIGKGGFASDSAFYSNGEDFMRSNILWVLAFFGLFMGTICIDGYIEAKEGLEVAMWNAHKIYAAKDKKFSEAVNQEGGE